MAKTLTSTTARIMNGLTRARRALGIVTTEEAETAYLNGATDMIDLEMRMREMSRHRRTPNGYGFGL